MARPRKGGERYASGKLKPQPDLGTDELRKQRERLVRSLVLDGSVKPDDPRLESALGRLLLLGKITQEQYEAGLLYAELHLRVFGPVSPQSIIGKMVKRGGI